MFGGGSFRTLRWAAFATAAAAVLLGLAARRRRRAARPPAEPPERREQRLAPALPLAALAAALLCGFAAESPGTAPIWWGAVAMLGFALAWELRRGYAPAPAPASRLSWEALLWAMAAGGAALALFANRPNIDDTFYVNAAVAAVDRPAAPLLSEDTLLGIPGLGLLLPSYRVNSVELLGALLASLTPLSPIEVAHLVLPGIFGAWVPLAYASALRWLAPGCWVWVTAVAMALLIGMGTPERSYGNFGFVHLQQGKAVFVSVFVPLLVSAAARFARRRDAASWALLFLTQVAAVGTTAVAIWAAPLVAALALAGALPLARRSLLPLLGGLAASAHPLLVGLALKAEMRGRLAWLEQVRQLEGGAPLDLRYAWSTTLGESSLALAALFACLTAWSTCRDAWARRLAVALPLGFALGPANPYLTPLLQQHVTGAMTYHRLLWALPVPLLLALLLATPLRLPAHRLRRPLALLLTAALTAAFAAATQPYSTLSRSNGTHRFAYDLKVPLRPYRAARALARAAPARSYVLAPERVSHWVGTFPGHPYALVPRQVYLDILRVQLEDGEWERRVRLLGLLRARAMSQAGVDDLRAGLAHYSIAAVCLDRTVEGLADLRAVLAGDGFEPRYDNPRYEVWARHSQQRQ